VTPNQPHHPPAKMSVSLSPSNSLGFNRPLTQLVKRSLTISNPNAQPVAFKVKTTAPKLYCVRPNSGRIEAGESIDISVMLQAMKEEPPLSTKCRDKFLIQSTTITSEKATLPLHDIWNTTDGGEEAKVHQQKLKVVYLPAEGQIVEEEDEIQANIDPTLIIFDPKPDTVQQQPMSNGHSSADAIPEPNGDQDRHINLEPLHEEVERTTTPPADFSVAREDSQPEEQPSSDVHFISRDLVTPSPSPSPPPAVAPFPVTNAESLANTEILAKYKEAQAEIERLRALLAAAPSSSSSELRRRTRALSDDGSTMAETEVGASTMIEDGPLHQEGVPLQVVVIIALGVFITTYLFF